MEDTYRWVDLEPGVSVWIKQENLIVALIALESTVEDDFLSGSHRYGMVGDSTGATARGLHKLPLGDLVEVAIIIHQRVDAGKVKAPHCRDRAFF